MDSNHANPLKSLDHQTSALFAESKSDQLLANSQEFSTQSGIIEVGLGWDFIAGMRKVDLDASAVLFSSLGTVIDAVYYNQLKSMNGNVLHSGDNKTGLQAGYDEKITINLDAIQGVSSIVFVLSAYSGGTFTDCESAFCEIKQNDTVLSNFSVGAYESGKKTSLILAILFRHPDKNTWHFSKIIQSTHGREFLGCMIPIRKYVDAVIDPGCLSERTFSKDKIFNMSKGDNISFPSDLMKFHVGLGWSTNSEGVDLDASCILLQDKDGDGDLDPVDCVYFAEKIKPGIMSHGDNRSGAGEGDDEVIEVDLNGVRPNIAALAFVVNIYTSGKTFKDVRSSYIRLFDPITKMEFGRFTLDSACKAQGVIFCIVYRGKNGEPWNILTTGTNCDGNTCKSVRCSLWDGSLDSPSGGDGCCSIS